jgi:Neutral/alkaline non-lysosomal ceramidase, N-terminal
MSEQLLAGTARVAITPPLGVDLMGYLRRSEPSRGYGQPMEATALVLDDGAARLVLIGADLVGASGAWARELRTRVGEAVGVPSHHVLVNSQHTHAAPPTPGWAKIGGDADWHEPEIRYAEAVGDLLVSSATEAARQLRPARIGFGRTVVDGITVNRRQRFEGGTILGWNSDEQCDRDVAVIRVDDDAAQALCTVVAFASHPVVVGPEVPEISSDFVGALRRRVREWTGGECVFLQACSGNIIPFESFHDRPGPEEAFAERLALAALAARAGAATEPSRPEQVPYASAVPIAVWRHVPTGVPRDVTLAAAERLVELPLLDPPTLEEIVAIRTELEERLADLKTAEEPRTAWNPVVLHLRWARAVEERVADGTVERVVEAPVQAMRIGEACITAWPCEPFCELGIEVKERSQAAFAITLGYSNDLVGYVATRREYPFGGYEPVVAQRHFGRPAPFAPEAGEQLVEHALELTSELFAIGVVGH